MNIAYVAMAKVAPQHLPTHFKLLILTLCLKEMWIWSDCELPPPSSFEFEHQEEVRKEEVHNF